MAGLKSCNRKPTLISCQLCHCSVCPYGEIITLFHFEFAYIVFARDSGQNTFISVYIFFFFFSSRTAHTLVLSQTTKGTDRFYFHTFSKNSLFLIDGSLPLPEAKNIQTQKSEVLKPFHTFMDCGNGKLMHSLRHHMCSNEKEPCEHVNNVSFHLH